ncbi:alginate export family protein [Stieleria sp. TO1_6]|uniref:alginate export family protein n=1 Tax=Stieleria tagensis TaxID=2956795 RepID=UPI00209AE231|nr:alginate export family protein [Stieleria tagensis]MCO8123865.1 alginate export family protein [Stieleria tagensis]
MRKGFHKPAGYWLASCLTSMIVAGSTGATELPHPASVGVAIEQPSQEPLPFWPAESAVAQAAPMGCDSGCDGQPSDTSLYPATIHPMPRPGIFPIPPKGPGYFSAWDQLTGRCRSAPPKSGYAPFAINAWPFFDADWRFVDGIAPRDRTLVEDMKRIQLNNQWMFSTGGEFWARYSSENNSRLSQSENDFTVSHVRQYADLWYQDRLRIYGEFIWADSFGEDLPPVPPDVDRGDILDLFFDLKLGEVAGKPVYLRSGRQELLYGSQRLVTPLPWANKRHSFDGLKIFRQGERWDFDAFWTKYVPPQANDFDTSDDNQTFAGLWLTQRPKKGEARDLYYLLYDNDNSANRLGITRAPFQTHTFGTRWAGDRDGLLWDVEGAMQFGNQGDQDLVAGMGTAGIGHRFNNAALSPTFWMYYDYASGDDGSSSDSHTFNQQFPFGHYYLGWMDLVGRQNIHDLNAHLYLYPSKWTTVWMQYHRFWLDESQDALYNAGGVPYRRDPTGAAGNDVGQEIDLVINFHLTRYSDVLVSYNKLFGGDFLAATAGPNGSVDADTLYLIFQQRW